MTETARKAAMAMLAMQRYPWEQGFCGQVLYEAGETQLWLNVAEDAVKRQSRDGRLAFLCGGRAQADPASAGEIVYRAWQLTGDDRFRGAAQAQLRYLLREAARTSGGLITHNTPPEGSPSRELWVDFCYMLPPFLAVMGELDEAVHQLNGTMDALRDPETGLLFHIYDAGLKKFVRRKLWATGNGWALLGIVRVAAEAERAEAHGAAANLRAGAKALLEAMAALRCDDGRFHDFLDEPDSFADGTAACMCAAAAFRGVCEGWLDASWRDWAEASWQAVAAKVDPMGIVREVCGSPTFDRQGTSAEAQAAFVLCDVWRGKAGIRP